MKKWLDDLYAILLRRGFNTLDNSLKNYDTFDKQITKQVSSGLIQSGGVLTYDLNLYNSNIYDTILVKFVFSNGGVAVIPFLRLGTNLYIRLNSLGVSPSFNVSFSGSTITITNNYDTDLNYLLYLNII